MFVRNLIIATATAATFFGVAANAEQRKQIFVGAESSASAEATSNSNSNATGGNASVVVEGDRRFTPNNCPQTLHHCQVLAEADALWAVGLRREAREHLRLLVDVDNTMNKTHRMMTGF